MNHQDFQKAYNQLEVKLRDLAKKNDDIYIPNIVPRSLADYILICMEPSLGGWAKNREEAENKLRGGFTNFLDGYNVMILHYAIRNYLCKNGQSYHITDLAKGAMLVKDANINRIERYTNWYPLLLEEINLVGTADVKVFTVGTAVTSFVESQDFPREITPLIHSSPLAAKHWNTIVQQHKATFEAFQNTVSHEDILNNAEEVIKSSGVSNIIRDRILSNLRKRSLTLPWLKLMFNYKVSFEAVASKSKE